MIDRWVKPSELLVEWGVEKANARIYAAQEALQTGIKSGVDEWIDAQEKFASLSAQQKQSLKDRITLEWVGVVLGSSSGVGASYDIKDLNLFFDSLQVGMVDGVVGVVISKKLLTKYLKDTGVTLTGSLANLVIPVLSGSYEPETQVELERLFDKTIKWKTQLGAYASVSTVARWAWLRSKRINEDTSAGIEAMTDAMKQQLPQLKIAILAGTDFADSSFKDHPENEAVYVEMKNVFDHYASALPNENQRELFLEDGLRNYVDYYRNSLYTSAAGTKFTGIGLGVLLLPGYNMIPVLTLSGEKIKTKWNAALHSLKEERATSSTTLSLREAWLVRWSHTQLDTNTELETNFDVFKLHDPDHTINISVGGKTPAHIKREGDYIIIAEDEQNLSVDIHTTHWWYEKTLIVAWGELGNDGLYVNNNHITDAITASITPNTSIETIFSYDQEALDSTESTREAIGDIVGHDALNHRDTIGMQELQRRIFAYQKWENRDLEALWGQFMFVITHEGFAKYAWKKTDQLTVIKSKISEAGLTPNKKLLLVQSVQNNLMEKTKLQRDGGLIKVDGGNQTISDYDEAGDRDDFFDTQFAKKYPSLLPKIQDARNDWRAINWEATQYSFEPISDGSMAFTWVLSYAHNQWESFRNIEGIMPYAGAYNIASIEGQANSITIEGLDINQISELIHNIPDHVLAWFKSILKLWSEREVKNYLVDGHAAGSVTFDTVFARMWECLNDAIILKNLKITQQGVDQPIGVSSTSEVYTPEVEVLDLVAAGVGKVKKKDEPKEINDESTSTGEDQEINDVSTDAGEDTNGDGIIDERDGTTGDGWQWAGGWTNSDDNAAWVDWTDEGWEIVDSGGGDVVDGDQPADGWTGSEENPGWI